jgi:hypothetical protein
MDSEITASGLTRASKEPEDDMPPVSAVEFTRLRKREPIAPPIPPEAPKEPDTPTTPLSPVKQMIGPVESTTTLNERHPDRPAVKLHLHLGPHGSADNLKALRKLNEKADVYMPENGLKQHGEPFRLLSHAVLEDMSPAGVDSFVDGIRLRGKPISDTFLGGQVRAIVGTNVEFGYIEPRPEEGYPDYVPEHQKIRAGIESLKDTLDDTLEHINSMAAKEGDLTAQRDGIMLGPTTGEDGQPVTAGLFEEEMDRIFAENPELKNKPKGEPVVVVDTHGSAHTSMYHRARAAGVDVEWSFAEMPTVFRPTIELSRKIALGKEPDRKLTVQCFVDEAIRGVLDYTIFLYKEVDDSDVVQYIRRRSAAFTEPEAQELFSVMKRDENKGDEMSETIALLDEMLQRKGFGPLPWEKEEMYDDIASHKAELAQKRARIEREDELRKKRIPQVPKP